MTHIEKHNPPATSAEVLTDYCTLARYVLFHAAAEDKSPQELFSDGIWVSNVVARYILREVNGDDGDIIDMLGRFVDRGDCDPVET